MITPDPLQSPNPPARRAAVVLIVLGSIALLLGTGLIAAGAVLPTLSKDPAVRQKMDELRKVIPVDPRVVFIAYGAIMATYGAAAVAVGLWVRANRRVAFIIGLVLVSLVATLTGLSALLSILAGEVGAALIPAAVCAVHLWLVKTLIEAMRQTTPATALPYAAPPTYRPMQAYYVSPQPPESVSRLI